MYSNKQPNENEKESKIPTIEISAVLKDSPILCDLCEDSVAKHHLNRDNGVASVSLCGACFSKGFDEPESLQQFAGFVEKFESGSDEEKSAAELIEYHFAQPSEVQEMEESYRVQIEVAKLISQHLRTEGGNK